MAEPITIDPAQFAVIQQMADDIHALRLCLAIDAVEQGKLFIQGLTFAAPFLVVYIILKIVRRASRAVGGAE